MPQNQIELIQDLLSEFDTAMLVTHGPDHLHRARPMAIARVESDCRLWFFTGRDTAKVHEIQEDQNILVVCQAEHRRYVSLSGTAEFISEHTKARELWKDAYKTWFPQGVDDPNLLLICVRPTEAEYWDSSGFKGVRYAFQAAKAYVTGRPPHVMEGEQHGRVALK